MLKRTTVLCDFDGTISIGDVGEMLLDNFLGGLWREIDDGYHAGEYGMIELYERSFARIDASETEFADFVEGARLDEGFAVFAAACAEAGLPLKIVSDGFDYYIDRLLGRANLPNIAIFANRLSFENGFHRLVFPNRHLTCTDCANCKQKLVDKFREAGPVVYVGNGSSDCCAAQGADLVYAKDALAEHFLRANLAFEPYNDFMDVLEDFKRKGMLAGRE